MQYNSFRGTKSYAAPEIITQHYYRAAPVDIWALGIILHILLTGEQPFESTQMSLRGCMRQPRRFSDAAADLLDGMFFRDPDYRYDIHDIMEHPWTKGVQAYPIPKHRTAGISRASSRDVHLEAASQGSQEARPQPHTTDTKPIKNGSPARSASRHAASDSIDSTCSMGSARAQMMDAVAVPMYDMDTDMFGFVTGTASMAWAAEHNYAPR
jgi:serine/threonine protein kinase